MSDGIQRLRSTSNHSFGVFKKSLGAVLKRCPFHGYCVRWFYFLSRLPGLNGKNTMWGTVEIDMHQSSGPRSIYTGPCAIFGGRCADPCCPTFSQPKHYINVPTKENEMKENVALLSPCNPWSPLDKSKRDLPSKHVTAIVAT